MIAEISTEAEALQKGVPPGVTIAATAIVRDGWHPCGMARHAAWQQARLRAVDREFGLSRRELLPLLQEDTGKDEMREVLDPVERMPVTNVCDGQRLKFSRAPCVDEFNENRAKFMANLR